MRTTIFRQYSDPWGSLPFPKGDTVAGSGCGLCSVTHILIESDKYKNYTPTDVRPYMVKWAVKNAGLIHDGIPDSLEHYGMKNVKFFGRSATMAQIFAECAKDGRKGVILFVKVDSRGRTIAATGPDGTCWTLGGHFIAFLDYKVDEKGRHWFYMKDSGSRKHDKWFCYETSMKGCVWKVWTCTVPDQAKEPAKKETSSKLSVDGDGGPATVRALEKFLNVSQTGIITGQKKSLAKYYPALSSVSYDGGGCAAVKALQKWAGAAVDGIWGQETSKAIQIKLRNLGHLAKSETIDGYFGPKSMKALQSFLNNPDKKQTSHTVIDVSSFQDPIDWTKVKASGVKGVIIRCGYRGAKDGKLKIDTMFDNHIKGAHKAGLKIGVYFFTQALTAAEGREEVAYTLNLIKKAGIPLAYPVGIDSEDVFYTENGKKKAGRANGLSKAKRTAAIKGFCDECKAQGYEPMIYASTSWLNNKLNMSKLPFKVWCAQYNSVCEYKGSYIMWQYTSTGSVSGVKGNVDMNHCYMEA